ncbi:hypothetical protein EJB05_18460, partial [Eragrostis curvula]
LPRTAHWIPEFVVQPAHHDAAPTDGRSRRDEPAPPHALPAYKSTAQLPVLHHTALRNLSCCATPHLPRGTYVHRTSERAPAGEMAMSFVLSTGARMPAVGLGTWQSDPGVVGNAVYAAVKRSSGESEIVFVQAGYRHIDCARDYGNEKEVGLALKKLFDEGVVKREDLFITSKLWCDHHAAEDVPDALKQSLDDLQLEYLDLYLIHWPFKLKKGTSLFNPENYLPLDIPGTWAAMEKLYDAGKARAIGVSNFSTQKLGDLLAVACVPPAVNQVECHPGWQQTDLHIFCQATGVHLTAYSPLGSPATAWVNRNILQEPIVISIAEKLGKTPAQVALRWNIQMGHSVLPKSVSEERIKQNLEVYDWSIPDDLLEKFSEIEQARLLRGQFFVNPQSIYKTLEELWDGEI